MGLRGQNAHSAWQENSLQIAVEPVRDSTLCCAPYTLLRSPRYRPPFDLHIPTSSKNSGKAGHLENYFTTFP